MLNEYRYKPNLNFFARYNSNSLGNIKYTNELKRETPVIVSLSSDEDSFDNLELCLYSILTQSLTPDRIILWLSNEYNLSDIPYFITKYIKNGLEIKFVKDIKEYTKTIYALKQFPKAINVTADECIYYNKDWLMKLYHSYIANANDIHGHIGHKILINNNKEILPFAGWKKHIKDEDAGYNYMLSDSGGILYPPDCFTKEVFRDDLFLKNNMRNADIWFWIMGILANRKFRIVKNHIKTISTTNIFNQLKYNQKEINTKNDEQIKTLFEYYRLNITQKLR